MPAPMLSHVILMVENPKSSALFYSRLLGAEPLEQSETFVLYSLPGGPMLGLWSKHTARPKVTGSPGSFEICFPEVSNLHVRRRYEEFLEAKIPIALEPAAMDGMSSTFVGLDPDGHRIRVFCLEGTENG